MPAIEFPSLADDVRKLPATGPARERQLYRLIDLHAAAEAGAALHASATRTRADVLTSADSVLGGDDAARDRFRDAVTSAAFLSQLKEWVRELREVASSTPDGGACTVASAFELWSWSVDHFRGRTAALDELAGAFAPLLAARALALDAKTALRRDLSLVYAARAAAGAGATCAELVFGYRRHLVWDAEGCASCYSGEELDEIEAIVPGIASGARGNDDVVEADGSHPSKRGPCVRFEGVEAFFSLRNKLDGCLTGSRMAKERAAANITDGKGRAS